MSESAQHLQLVNLIIDEVISIVATNMDKEMRETTITNGKNSEEKIESVVSI